MKGIFSAILLAVMLVAGSFVAYGVYLNSVSVSYVESVQARRVVSVAASVAHRQAFRPGIDLPGVHMSPATMTDVICQVEGILEKILITPGDVVEKGQTVCILDNPLLPLSVSRAEADVRKAEVNTANAATRLERARRLRQERAISQSEFDTTETQMLASEAEELAARASLADAKERLAFQNVESKMHGEVLLVYQTEGRHLDYGSPVMLIGDFSSLIFFTNLSDKVFSNLLPLEKDYEFTVDLLNNHKAFNTNYADGFDSRFTAPASIIDFSPPLSQPSDFRNVMWRIDNRQGALEPGLYTNVSIHGPDRAAALLVPDIAILAGGDAVFVVTPEGKLDRRTVKTGRGDGEMVEIVEGLREGDVVVESDVRDLRIGDAVSPILPVRSQD